MNKRKYSTKQNKYNTFEFEKRLETYRIRSEEKALEKYRQSKLKQLYSMRNLLSLILFLVVFYGAIMLGIKTAHSIDDIDEVQTISLDELDDINNISNTSFTMLSLGNLLCHNTQYFDAATVSGYDFDYVFEDVKDVISSQDFTIATFETTLAGQDVPYSNYPRFNTPDEFALSIANSGIDLVTNATNHCLDYGEDALKRTNQILDTYGIEHIGTFQDEIYTKNINGINTSFFSYTFSTNGIEDMENNVNKIEKEKIKEDLKKSNSDLKIVMLHNGEEYLEGKTKEQEELFDFLIENGANIIIENHPHVIAPMEKRTVNEKDAIVIYSQGNLTSDMKEDKYQVSYGVKFYVNKLNEQIEISTSLYKFFMLKDTTKTKKFKLINLDNIEQIKQDYMPDIIEKLEKNKEYISTLIPKEDITINIKLN